MPRRWNRACRSIPAPERAAKKLPSSSFYKFTSPGRKHMKNYLLGTALAGLVLVSAPAFAQAPSAAITAAVADAGRTEADKAADDLRKPAETIAFAGVKPGDKVAEL